MMNTVDQFSMPDPETLDRLVDGELSDEDERALLARLDRIPDGWRRCAGAFLEARCWQRSAQSLVGHKMSAVRVHLPPRTRFLRLGSPWVSLIALAAVFLVAFGVGTVLPRRDTVLPRRDTVLPRRDNGPAIDSLVQSPASPASPAFPGNQQTPPALAQEAAEPDPGIQPANAEDLYLGDLRLVNDSGKEIAVPVYDWNQQVAEEIWRGSQPLPAEVVGQLKRHQVRSQRGYVPVRLQDGRQVVLPVQEVNIVPVGGIAY